jgi:hypothetical protein
MIISVKDKMYAVDFHHITQEPNRSTVCLIAPFDPNKKKPTFKEYFFSSGTSEPVIEGQAFCHENDQFCKATGRRLAFTRALQNGGFSQPERKEFWEQYFASGVKP